MPPLRVGLVGLGPVSTGPFNAGEWGIQHMNAILDSPHLELVAVCNSTVESAQRSITSHGLGPTVKAYGSMETIAADPDVDLVAVVVHLDKHFGLVKTLLELGKNVLVEFPATGSVKQTSELAALAKSKGLKVVVGSQGRADPAVAKLKELVDSNAIGKVVYSTLIGHTSLDAAQGWPASQSGFLDLHAGISRANILLGHQIDTFMHVVGTFSTIQTTVKTKLKEAKLLGADGQVVDLSYPITSPDIFLIQGVTEGGAAASFQLRTNEAPADGVGFRWIISGTEGEIIITGDPGFFHMGITGGKILLRKGASEAEEISFQADDGGEHRRRVGPAGVNTFRLYEAIANGEAHKYANIEQSLATHEVLDKIRKDSVWAP